MTGSVSRDTYKDDLAQWKADVDKKLAQLFKMTASRPQLGVTDGDFTVEGGGRVQVLDVNGVRILDVGGGSGIQRPYIPWTVSRNPFFEVNQAEWNFDIYAALWTFFGHVQHPALNIWVAAGASIDSPGGLIRVGVKFDVNSADPIVYTAVQSVPAAGGYTLLLFTATNLTADYGRVGIATVEARLEGSGGEGPGEVYVTPYACVGTDEA